MSYSSSRRLRLKVPVTSPGTYHHCISRVADGDFILGEEEKDYLVELMREYERFCGVKILTYCMMSDHFHVLLEVPARPQAALEDQELIAKVRRIPGSNHAELLEQELAELRQRGDTQAAEALKQRVGERMFDLSQFMKTFKQRFSRWYNPAHGRTGTLWEQRYKSILVEGTGLALGVVAAYVDLNPVRAGLVSDPKDYRWCGYGEALSGGSKAKEGIRRMMTGALGEAVTFKEAAAEYQELLFGPKPEGGAETAEGRGAPHPRSAAELAELEQAEARLPIADYLRMRVRYFSDGVAVGSRDFVNRVFTAYRDRFSAKRKDGARQLRLVDSEELYALRNLRRKVFGKPPGNNAHKAIPSP